MNGLGLLVGHLLGDYVSQTDWMAANKTTNSWICAIHCFVYSLMVWSCTFLWFPLWAVALVGLLHFPVDRWRLARKMMTFTGQEGFATGPMAPWSIVIVDNTAHLLVLFLLGTAVETVYQEAWAWGIAASLGTALLLAGGAYWYWRTRIKQPTPSPSPETAGG